MKRLTLSLLLLALGLTTAHALDPEDILPPDQAFSYEAIAEDGRVKLRWTVADGYYMYRHRFGFASNTDGITLDEAQIPPGKAKVDEFFGPVETYRKQFEIIIPFKRVGDSLTLDLEIKSQGCADIGLCFPPQTWVKTLDLPFGTGTAATAGNGVKLLKTLEEQQPLFQDTGEFLHPDQAFVLSTTMMDAYTLRARWDIADGYYIYKDKIAFTTDSDLVQLGTPTFPSGKFKEDEFFGRTEVFFNQVDILIPVSRVGPDAGEFDIQAKSQGCAEDGICYPPREESTFVALPDATNATLASIENNDRIQISEQDLQANMIREGGLFALIAKFFGAGLLLAFTPCVLPMVPILSGIISGQGENVTRGRAFALSLTYVLGMALTYTIGGTIAATFGSQLQSVFQQTWIIVTFSGLFVVLALSMFGFYEVQMPSSIQTRLTSLSNKQQTGTFIGTAVMGILSALIVTTCVAPPLIAALIVIGESGELARGALALFAMSIGMGTPLLVVGASAGELLPKAGAWMTLVKGASGVMLLGLAIWFLERVLDPQWTMILWATLFVGSGLALIRFNRGKTSVLKLGPVFSAAGLAYGALVLASGLTGGHSPWKPLAGSSLFGQQVVHLEFQKIKTVDDLQSALQKASVNNQVVMLDFYADWCVSCKEMEKYTFTVPEVQTALADTILLQADVTANDEADQALLKYIGIYGPPTIAFFDQTGHELEPYRLVGFVKAPEFVVHVQNALKENTSRASL